MDNWILYARRPRKKGGFGPRKPRAQGLAKSGHDAIRADGCNFRKVGGRWGREYITPNGTRITAEKGSPIDGLRPLRNLSK